MLSRSMQGRLVVHNRARNNFDVRCMWDLNNEKFIQGEVVITPRTFWVFGFIKLRSAKKTKFLSAWCY